MSRTHSGIGIFLLFVSSVLGQDNYSQWNNHKNIVINTSASGANITGNVTQYPLLVRLTLGNFTDFTLPGTKTSLRFGRGATHLPYQVERWDSAGGNVAEIWVLVDTVFGNDTSSSHAIQMYWGKAGAGDSADNAPGYSGAKVFSSSNSFVGVWHLGNATGINPRPNAVTGAPAATPSNDSTGQSFGGGAGSYAIPEGVIGKADTLRGGGSRNIPRRTSDYFNLGNAAGATTSPFTGTNTYAGYSNFSTGLTYSLWVKPGVATGDYSCMLELANTSGADNNIHLFRPTQTTTYRYQHNNGATAGSFHSTASGTMVLGTWQHVVVTVGTGSAPPVTVYLNGVVSSATLNASFAVNNVLRTNAWIGKPNFVGDAYFVGSFDEPEISNVARSADWIALSYQTQKVGSSVVNLGPTLGTSTVPGAPTGVAGVAGNGQVAVNWSAPVSNGGTSITAYTVTSSPGSFTCTTTGGTSCTVTGLTNGTSYTFTVTATNAVGTGSASSPSASVTPAIPVTVPGAPLNVAVTAGNGQVVVSWTAPSSNGGGAITAYTVTSSPGSFTCATTGGTTCTVTGLTNGIGYTLTVTATNAAGTGPASLPSPSVTPVAPIGDPGPPTGVSGTPGNGQVSLSWLAPVSNGGSTITGYTVTSNPDGKTCTTTGALSCVVTTLTNGSSYTFTVTATNSAGTGLASTPSAAVTPIGPPGPPTSVTAAPGNGQAVVSWSAPSSNGGSAIILYTATASPGGATCISTGSLTCTITGLAANVYTFTVIATNSAAGAGTASVPSSSVTAVQEFSGKNGFWIHLTGSSAAFHLPSNMSGTQVSVMDLWGRTVWSQAVGAGGGELVWNGLTSTGRTFNAGLYFVRLKSLDGQKNVFSDVRGFVLTH